jgi:hypothetical protein
MAINKLRKVVGGAVAGAAVGGATEAIRQRIAKQQSMLRQPMAAPAMQSTTTPPRQQTIPAQGSNRLSGALQMGAYDTAKAVGQGLGVYKKLGQRAVSGAKNLGRAVGAGVKRGFNM